MNREDRMRNLLWIVIAGVFFAGAAFAKTLDEYVEEARDWRESGDLEKAAAAMQAAIDEFPDSALAHAYLGLYRGMQAGGTGDFMEAGRLSSESFQLLDRAVELGPDNPRAHLYRGLMGVKVPEFMGRLEEAIADLEFVVKAYEEAPEAVSGEVAVSAYQLLGEGYSKKKNLEKAKAAWARVIELAPGTPSADQASKSLEGLSAPERPVPRPAGQPESRPVNQLKAELEAAPDNVDALVALGKAHIDDGNHIDAEKALRKAVELDPENPEAYMWLAVALEMSVSDGEVYDERIYEDANWATNLVFEIIGYLDKAVELAPDDIEARLLRGIAGVNFPFFAGRIDQGLGDLEMALKSDLPDSVKAEAAYWLGFGYRKKGMSFWTEVVTEYSNEEMARIVFDGMRPPIKRFDASKHIRPVVAVDFVVGFQDQLPPQIAVWIETEQGSLVRTLYVSGFSGNVKERQIVLPVWASATKFVDADAVTAASIDIGEHIFVWDLKDFHADTVAPGRYTIKVEADFWPSNLYEMTSTTIEIGEAHGHAVVEEGNLIPYLEVTYLP
jgi:tetratricopeptide (TPR) repeat protein